MKFKLPTFSQVDWRDWKTYLLLLPVVIVFLFYKPLEALRSRVWNKSGFGGGALHEVMAIGAGMGGAIGAAADPNLPFAHSIGSTWEGIFGFFLTWAYGFPIIWLLGLYPGYKAVKWCWNHLEFVDKKILGPILSITPKAFSWLPGMKSGWAEMKDGNWFVVLVGGISYATAGLAAIELGLKAKGFVEGSLHFGALGHEFVLGAGYTALLLVAGFLGRVFLGAIAEGNKEGVGSIVAAATTYGAYGWLDKVSMHFGVPTLATAAVTYVLAATYGFPLLYKIFASGFWKRLWNRVEPAISAYFEGKETAFRHIVLQSLGIALAVGIAGASWLLCAVLAANIVVAILVSAFCFLAVYAVAAEFIDKDHGNLLLDLVIALALGASSAAYYLHLGLVFAIYGAIACGIVSAIASFLIFPLIYTGVEWVANVRGVAVVTNWLGAALPGLHKKYIDKVVEPTVDACESVYNTGYGRNNKDAVRQEKFAAFRKLTLHSTNGVLAWGFSALAVAGVHQLLFVHAFEPAISYVVAAAVALLSIGLLGRVIFNAGLELSGLLAACYVGLKVGVIVLPAQTFGLWFAVPFAVLAAGAVYGLGYPLCLIALNWLTSWAAPALNVPLDWVNYKAWAAVRGVWKTFGYVFEFVYDLLEPLWKWFGRVFARIGRMFAWIGRLLSPLWIRVASVFAASWNACRSIWKGIFG